MIEQQVQIVVNPVHGDSLLPFEKGKPDTQFQDERLHFPQDRSFQVLFGVGVLEAKEVEQVGIAEDQVRRELVFFAELFSSIFGQVPVGFRERAVRSKSMDWIFFSSVRVFQRSIRHISA